MIQLYGLNKTKLHGLKNYKDLKVERELFGDEVLSFSYPNLDSKYDSIKEECYIRTRKNEYVVKEINIQDDWTEFVAKINVEDIKGKAVNNFETVEQTCANAVNLALVGTVWTIGSCDVTKKRTVRKANCSSYEILQEIKKVYLCDFRFDAINKKIYIYSSMGSDKGVYFSDSLNLRKLDIQSNSYDFITRLIPIGKDGLKITDINGGKEYVENYQYSNKVITAYWEDNRYTVIENLKADAIAKLNELSKPFKSYSADIIDLARLNDKYKNVLDYDLGDTITLISKDKKVKEKQRIVRLIEYPDEPERNTCEIANKTLRFQDIQADNQDIINAADNVITSDGMIDNSKVDFDPIRLEVITLVAEKANIGELNAAIANIGELNATKANITELNAAVARIGTLEVGSATIIQLNAVSARISILEADAASINNLLSQNISTTNLNAEKITAINANILDLQAGKANVVDLTAAQAEISNLKSSKANITDLTVTNANITNLTSKVATIDTLINGNITSANMAAGAIKANDAVIANGAISSAQIISLDVAKINAGDISTNKFRIVSNNGNMLISDNTIQIKDSTRVRVQIGKDASNDYNMYVWDSSGNLMFDATGIKASGIKSKIIRDDMVSDTANISGSKIEKESLIVQINGATTTLKGSRIKLDAENQTLDVAFTSLKSTVTTTANTVSSQGTAISTIQGQITSKIWNTDITTAVNNIRVGGRNYLQKNGLISDGGTITNNNDGYTYNFTTTTLNQGYKVNLLEQKVGKVYTLSYLAKYISGDLITFGGHNRHTQLLFSIDDVVQLTSYHNGTTLFPKDNLYHKVIFTFKVSSTALDGAYVKIEPNRYNGGYTTTMEITNIKLEEGTIATDWTPAPEDVESKITSINDKYSTLTQTIDGITTSVASLNSSIDITNGNVTAVDNKVSTLTQTVNGLTSTVTSVQQNYLTKSDASTTYSTNTRVSTLEQTVNGLSSTVSSVQTNYLTKADATTTYSTNTRVATLEQSITGLSSTVSSVQTTANSKKRVFTATPTTPYDVGDLWVSTNGTGDLMTCKTARSSGAYTSSDWVKGVKYTDDTTANNVQTNLNTTNSNLSSLTNRVSTAESSITQVNNSINLKVNTSDFTSYQTTVTNSLNSKANQSSLDTTNSNLSSLTTRVSSTESSISILQSQISLKVEQTHITTAINNIQVGGRNLLLGTSEKKSIPINLPISYAIFDPYTTNNKKTLRELGFSNGDIVCISFDWEISKNGGLSEVYGNFRAEWKGINSSGVDNQYLGLIKNPVDIFSVSNINGKANITTQLTEGVLGAHTVRLRIDNSVIIFSVSKFKLEKGNKATDWTPAPEDISTEIDTKITAAKAEIKVTTDSITSSVSSVQSSVNSLGTRVTTAEGSITTLNNSISLKVNTTDFNSYKTTNDSAVNSKASQTALNTTNGNVTTLTNRVTTAESSISVLQGQIVSKVSQTEIDNSIDSIQIGGKNLVRNSTFNQQGNYWASIPTSNMYMILNAESDKPNSNILEFNYPAGSAAAYLQHTQRCLVKADNTEKYVVGFDIYVQTEGDVLDSAVIFSNRLITTATGSDWSNISDINFSHIKSQIVYGKWTRVYISRTIPNNATKKYFAVGLYRSNVTSVTKYKLREIKIELGTKATDWSPAPEDIQGQIDSTTSRISTAETSITQLSNSIALKVDTSTYNSKMSNLDGSISSLNNRMNSAELKITDSAIVSTVRTSTAYTNDLNQGVLYCRGTGNNRPANRLLTLNGSSIYNNNTRGLRLTIIDRINLSVTFDSNYDVFGGVTARNDLATKLNSLNDSVIVVLTSFDAITIDDNLATAMSRCGGSGVKLTYRNPYALVGIPSIGQGAGIEVYQTDSATAPHAEITTKITNGIPQGINTTSSQILSRMSSAESSITQTANEITQRVTTSEFNSYKTQTTNEIASKVSSNEFISYKSQTDSAISQKVSSNQFSTLVEQNSTSVRIAVGKVGGDNLIRNGAFKFNINSWQTNNSPQINATQNWTNYPGRQTCFIGSNGTLGDAGIFQRFNTIVGRKYTCSFRAGKDGARQNGFLRAGIEGHTILQINDVWATNNDPLHRITFTATSTLSTFIAYNSDKSGACYITEIKVEEGENTTAWSQHQDELGNTDVKIDSTGVKISNGGLTVSNSNGVVTIDGSSNILKIHSVVDLNLDAGGNLDYSYSFVHALGYVPVFQAYQTDTPSSVGGNTAFPALNIGGGTTSSLGLLGAIRASADSNRIYITYRRANSTVASSFKVRVFIFREALL